MKKRTELYLILAISLILGAAVTVCSELGALTHLSDREEYRPATEVQSVLITGTGRASVLFSDESPESAGRFIHRLRMDLYSHDGNPLKLKITVHTQPDRNGSAESYELYDVNPLYVTGEVLKLDREHVISVDLETEDRASFSVGTVSIDNSFYFSPYLFVFTVLAAFALLYAFCAVLSAALDRDRPSPETKIRRLFVTAALCLGTALVVCLPSNKVGYDEETHLQAVLALASFPSNELHISDGLMFQVTVTEFNNPEVQPGGGPEQEQLDRNLAEDVDYKLGRKTPEFEVLWNRVPAYFGMAAVMKAGKGLSLSWPAILKLTRAANLLIFIALVWIALKALPCGHLLMALIALFPQSLFLASTVSYDPFVTGCLFAGTAYALRLMQLGEEGGAFRKDLFLMILFFVLGCLPKAVYAPLMLIAVLIPFRRTDSRKQRVISIIVLAALAILLLAVFTLPTLLDPPASGDIRGGQVSEQSQLEFILHEPLAYTGILLSQMVRWLPQCCFGADCTTFMGHLVNGTTQYHGPVALVLSLLAAAVAGGIGTLLLKKRTAVLCLAERAWILFLCFGASVLIWTAMYMAFTEPGAAEIAGVQGRYFIPILFPLYFALGAELPAGRLLVRKEDLWYYIIIFGMVAAGAAEILRAVVLPFGL